jgi:E3 ubiquitin-protein ligase SHPRH
LKSSVRIRREHPHSATLCSQNCRFNIMPRTKQTARGPFSRPVGGRQNSRDTSSSSSSIATPNNEYISSTSSESGSEEPSHRELPDELIEFVSQEHNVSEPPRKRQKVERTSSLGKDPELEHIVVHQSRWEIQCMGSKLSELHTPIERSDIRPYIYWAQHWGPSYIEINDDTKQQVFHATIPPKETLKDVHLALLVDQETRKWARLQGRLWTEFGISLYQKDGLDCIELVFTLKWNTTTSPYNVLPAASKTQALLKVM